MPAPITSPQPLRAVVESIFTSRCISRQDQETLMSLLLAKEDLSMEERALIDEIFNGLRRGILRVG